MMCDNKVYKISKIIDYSGFKIVKLKEPIFITEEIMRNFNLYHNDSGMYTTEYKDEFFNILQKIVESMDSYVKLSKINEFEYDLDDEHVDCTFKIAHMLKVIQGDHVVLYELDDSIEISEELLNAIKEDKSKKSSNNFDIRVGDTVKVVDNAAVKDVFRWVERNIDDKYQIANWYPRENLTINDIGLVKCVAALNEDENCNEKAAWICVEKDGHDQYYISNVASLTKVDNR